jgi:uncharacterized protein YutE (UPF0331/DUF86 family)
MVNEAKVEGLLRNLERTTGHLHSLAALRRDEFLADPIKIGAARYYLQVSIECCLDLANHIIASERFRAPQDYADTFKVLNEKGAFPDDFTRRLQQMARFRNLLVHLYTDVDDAQIYESLRSDLSDFEAFVGYLLGFLAKLEQGA